MKGFVFTLDAIFSLVFAAFAISALVYVSYSGYIPPSIQTPQVSAISRTLLSASLQQLGQMNPIYGAGSGGTWPQYGADSGLSFGGPFGPGGPYLLYSYTAAANIIPAPVASGGYVAFTTSNLLYELNATTGAASKNFPVSDSNIVGGPLFYRNYLIYANSIGYIKAVSAANGQQVWNTPIPGNPKLTSPLEFESGYIVFGASTSSWGQIYFLNPTNGTIAENDLITTGGANGNVVWIAQHKGDFYIGVGKTFNGIIRQSFVNASISPSNSFASYGNYALLWPSNTVALYSNLAAGYSKGSGILNLSGVPYYQYAQASTFTLPRASFNTTPSIGGNVTYLLSNGVNFDAFRIGGQLFNVTLPKNAVTYGYSDIALAYGNAYVADGNSLYVFGTGTVQTNSSLLAALGSMYLSGRGSLADYVLYSIYGSGNIGIFINGSYAPALHVAKFNGVDSYISVPARPILSPEAGSVGAIGLCGWYRINTLTGYHGLLFKGTQSPSSGNTPEFAVDNATARGFTVYGASGSVAASYGITLTSNSVGSWNFFCFSYNSTSASYYLNGTQYTSNNVNIAVTPGVGSGSLVIGAGTSGYSNVSVTNLQLYNSILLSPKVGAIYYEGPFGEPVNKSGLVGWWPLLGDGNDYSGSSLVGYPSNMMYNSANYISSSLSRSVQVGGSAIPLQLNNNGGSSLYNVSVVVWSG
jgi:hypothetical protein